MSPPKHLRVDLRRLFKDSASRSGNEEDHEDAGQRGVQAVHMKGVKPTTLQQCSFLRIFRLLHISAVHILILVAHTVLLFVDDCILLSRIHYTNYRFHDFFHSNSGIPRTKIFLLSSGHVCLQEATRNEIMGVVQSFENGYSKTDLEQLAGLCMSPRMRSSFLFFHILP